MITAFGDIFLSTDQNFINSSVAGAAALLPGGRFVIEVGSLTLSDLGGLVVDQTLTLSRFDPLPATGNLLVSFGNNTPPGGTTTLDNLNNNPQGNTPPPDNNQGQNEGDGGLQGGGILQTAFGGEEDGEFVGKDDGFVGLDNFGNTQNITDPVIVNLLKKALGDGAQKDLLAALGLSAEQFQEIADGGNMVTPGEVFDMGDLSSGTLDNAPQSLKDALSEEARQELQALLDGILATTGSLEGVTVTVGQVVDMDGNPIPNMPPVLLIALSPQALSDLEAALQ